MKGDAVRKWLSGSAVLGGLLWIIFISGSMIVGFWDRENFMNSLLMIFPSLLVSFPGVLLLIAGFWLWRERCEASLKMIVGVFSFTGVSILMGLILDRLEAFGALERDRGDLLLFMVVAWTSLAVYFVVIRLVVWKLSGEKRRYRDFIGRGMLTLMALVLWLFLNDLGDAFLKSRGEEELLWFALPTFGSIAIALVFYKAACLLIPAKTDIWREKGVP